MNPKSVSKSYPDLGKHVFEGKFHVVKSDFLLEICTVSGTIEKKRKF